MPWDVSSWWIDQARSRNPVVVRRLHAGYVKDKSQNQRNAPAGGYPVFVAGTVAPQAMVLDGNDDYLAVSGYRYAASSLADPFTVEARVEVSSSEVGSANTVVGWSKDSYWSLQLVNGYAGMAVKLTGVGASEYESFVGSTSVADGNLHHIAARVIPNSKTVDLYVDGSPDVTHTDSRVLAYGNGEARYGFVGVDAVSQFFNGFSTGSDWFQGRLEEVRVWDTARTDAEIAASADSATLDDTTDLRLHYNFDAYGDISDRVLRWPSVPSVWNDFRPRSVKVDLAGEDGMIDEMVLRSDFGLATFAAQIGFRAPSGGEELITPFVGHYGSAKFTGGKITVAIEDKAHKLSDIAVGAYGAPKVFSGTTTLPSDIAWDVLTSDAGFSSVQSTSNPDIDWASFQEWAAVFSGDSVHVQGYFDGQKVTEVLRKLSRYTQSAIYMEGERIKFNRFSAINTVTVEIDQSEVLRSTAEIDMDQLVTKPTVLAGYNVDSREWGIATTHVSTGDVAAYGEREITEQDRNLWYTDSVSALNLAQRYTNVGGTPYNNIRAATTLGPLAYQIGETISYIDTQLGLSRGYRIMERQVNMDDATVEMSFNASQVETPFLLDISELDGTDKLL